jgi:D-amino-acid dehydrogenase
MKSVLVIGGGVIGLCTAYYAAERGHQVTVLDRSPAGHAGCSYGNAGMVVPSHFVPLAAPGAVAQGLKWMANPESPFYVKPRADWELIRWGLNFWRASNAAHVERSSPLLRDLHFASRVCFEELAGRPGANFGLVQKGLLMLCKTDHALEEEARAALTARGLGVPAEILAPDEAAALDPGVRMDIAGAVYFPKDCHLSPQDFMADLTRWLEAKQVRTIHDAEVTGFERDSAKVTAVMTRDGKFSADEYVLCGGSWSSEVGRKLGLSIPMQPGKGYSLTLAKPRQLPKICAIFTEARVAVTPMGSTLRVGGTMEMAGLNEEINPVRVQGIIKSVPQYYPEFTVEDFAGIQPWRGLRPCSPDGLPYVGRTKRFANLSVATGHAMMGLSLGPITGRLMAEILSDERPSLDLRLLDPDRYA